MNEKKIKYAYWMRPSMVAEIEEMLSEANATSKSDFVCKAVNFYIGYLKSQKNMDYLAPLLSSAIKSEIRSTEKHICEMLFKVAVEQAMNNHIVAANYNIDYETLESLRDLCSDDVSQNNGVVTFEEAYDYQKG